MLVVGLAAILFAVSNRQMVDLTVWPFPFTLPAPIYAVALTAVAIGVVWGGAIGWWGAVRARRRARLEARRAADLEKDLHELKIKIDVLERRPVSQESSQQSIGMRIPEQT